MKELFLQYTYFIDLILMKLLKININNTSNQHKQNILFFHRVTSIVDFISYARNTILNIDIYQIVDKKIIGFTYWSLKME